MGDLGWVKPFTDWPNDEELGDMAATILQTFPPVLPKKDLDDWMSQPAVDKLWSNFLRITDPSFIPQSVIHTSCTRQKLKWSQ